MTYRITKSRFYVEAITARSGIVGYGVYDCIGGMASRHHEFMIDPKEPRGADIARHLAKLTCADMNEGIE